MNRCLTFACLLAGLLATADARATPNFFDGNPAPVNAQLTGSGIPVTVRGGQLLYRSQTFAPSHDGGMYGSTSRLPGYANPITFTFAEPVTTVRVTIWNLAPTRLVWNGQQVSANGIRQNTFAGPLTELSIETFNLDASMNPTTDWDFAVFQVSTDQGVVDLPEVTPPPAPPGVTITKVADGDTPQPGGGSFGQVGTTATISESGIVTFLALGSAPAIVASDGGVTSVVVDRSTPIPGGSGTFASFAAARRVGNTTAFQGVDGSSREGVYLATDGGSVALVADESTIAPGGSAPFTSLFHLAYSGGAVAFIGISPDGRGIYTDQTGALSRLALVGDPVPGSTAGTFDGFSAVPGMSATTIAFYSTIEEPDGMGGVVHREGIYRFTGGVLARVADETTPIPGGTGSFTSFGGSVAVQEDSVYFVGLGAEGQAGIYVSDGTSIERLVDTGTAIPGGAFGFRTFGPVAVSGSAVTFQATGLWGQAGVFLLHDGVVRTLLKHDNPVDETHVAASIALTPTSQRGAQVAVAVPYGFGQGRGIFLFGVEPLCGDGVVGGDEQCDDGNVAGGDGCSAECRIEVVGDRCSELCARPEALHVAPSNVALVGTAGDDVLCGDERPNTLRGNRGADVLCGFGGDDVLYGGRGADEIHGGAGDDVLRGDDGDDVLRGGDDDDRLLGGAGHDDLQGGDGDDVLRGGSGDDQLDGGDGTDRAYGQAGDDTCDAELTASCDER